MLTKGAPSRQEWTSLLARTEAAGFTSLLMPTHSTPQFSVIAALADAAVRSNLTIGTLVANNDLQHPALLARDAATLALLSGGRFELGVGAGWMVRDYTQLGLPLLSGGARVDKLAEAISILRSSWTGEEFSFHGSHYDLAEFRGLPATGVPLMMGAGGDRMLALAAASADIVSFSRSLGAGNSAHDIAVDATLGSTLRKARTLAQHLGDRRSSVELNILAIRVEISPRYRERVREVAEATGLAKSDVVDTPENFFAATAQDMADQLMERRRLTGISYYVIRDQDIDACAPVLACLVGR
nr:MULTISPECIES: TIGR03621 family F420-dependent LLM class oxidoreductase [Streptomyces]